MALRGVGAALENVGQSLTVFSREQMERDAAARAAAQAQAATAAEGEKQRTFQEMMEGKRQAGAVKLQGMEALLVKQRDLQAQTAQDQRYVSSLPDPEEAAAFFSTLPPERAKAFPPDMQARLLAASGRVTDNKAAQAVVNFTITQLGEQRKLVQQRYMDGRAKAQIMERQIAAMPVALRKDAENNPEYLQLKAAIAADLDELSALQLKINDQSELKGKISGVDKDLVAQNTILGRSGPGGKPSASTSKEAPMTSAANADLLAQLVDKGQQAKAAQNLSRPEMEKLLKASEAGKQLSPAQIQLVLDQIYPSR